MSNVELVVEDEPPDGQPLLGSTRACRDLSLPLLLGRAARQDLHLPRPAGAPLRLRRGSAARRDPPRGAARDRPPLRDQRRAARRARPLLARRFRRVTAVEDRRWGTGRIEAFSDGVFAIAITLLILEVRVPRPEFDNLWRGIAEQWPSYLVYATSFITIGGLWLVHHGMFRRLEYANDLLTRLNLVLLMVVAFLPFPTTLLAEAIRQHGRRACGRHLLRRHAVRDLGADQPHVEGGRARSRAAQAGGDRRGDPLLPLASSPNLGFYAVVILLADLRSQGGRVRLPRDRDRRRVAHARRPGDARSERAGSV